MTCTVVGWHPVFTPPDAVQLLLDSTKHLQQHSEFQRLEDVTPASHWHRVARTPNLVHVM